MRNPNNEHATCRANTTKTTGKFCFESIIKDDSPAGYTGLGDNGIPLDTTSVNLDSGAWMVESASGNKVNADAGGSAYCSAFTVGEVLMTCIDFDANKIWWAVGGTFCDGGDPGAGTGEAFSNLAGELWPLIAQSSSSYQSTFNFTDMVGTLPTGFSAWDTAAVTTPLFTVTLIDTYDNVTLNNFTATLFNSTDTLINTTTSGEVNFTNIGLGTYSLNITGINDSGGYFNQSFRDVDASSAFQANAFQSVLRLRAADGFNNNTINDFSAVTNQSSDSTSNGLILILAKGGDFALNVTASSFDDLFTNFSLRALENISLNVTMGSIFNFNLIRESTGNVFDFNATNQTTLNIFCPNQTIQIFFNTSSNASQIVTCRFDLMQMTVDYGALGSYFRTLIPPVTQKNITWYLIDVKKGDVAIQRIIQLLDLTREFTNAKLSVTRAVSGVVRTIIEQRFDISNNVNLFLVQNGLYSLSIDNGVSVTILGNLIPTEAGTQTITLPKIDFVPSETILGDNVSWSYSLNVTTNVLRMQYLDKVEKTTFVKFTVFNETNAQLFSGESTDTSDVTITFNQAFANRTYSTELFFIHPDLSNHTDKKVFYGIGDTSSGALELQGWTPTEQRDIKKWVAYIFLIVWVLIFSSVHSGLAIATMTIWLWMFRLWQWVEVSGIIFGFLILIGVVAWIVEAMRKN
ncbi:MAG TPA: hypothetical protein ENH82_17020 [bacterium]|nr:hypothetical protein [bacterium]